MRNNKVGPLYICCRFIARRMTARHQFVQHSDAAVPAVYLVHHQNTKGPFITMAWLPFSVRPWVLGVFCSPKGCFDQYYHFTFTKRFGMPKAIAAVCAYPLSYFVSAVMKSMRSIAVFRDSKAIVTTFMQSIDALTDGESLLISPDIDYDSTDPEMGEMYQGFLDLEKFYWKQTGQHLAFIPLFISEKKRYIFAGEPIYFQKESEFKREKADAYSRLKQEFSRLANQINQ
jgi:hypothetical protein